MKIAYVDKENCTSCNACVEEVPDVFQMDEDDLAEVYNAEGASEDDIQDTIESCPGECILWKE